MFPEYPSPLIKCTLIHLPDELINDTSLSLNIIIKDVKHFDQLIWDFKASGQTTLKSEGFDYETVLITDTCESCHGNFYFMKMYENNWLPTKDNDCFLTPMNHQWNCIQQFIKDSMNCSTPWETDQANNGQEWCQSKEQMYEYFEFRRQLSKGTFDEELENMECMKPNCKQFSWKTKKISSVTKSILESYFDKEDLKSGHLQYYFFEVMRGENVRPSHLLKQIHDINGFICNLG